MPTKNKTVDSALAAEIMDDASSVREATTDDLTKIRKLAERALDLECELKMIDLAAKGHAAELLQIQTEHLPELMRSIGMTNFTLQSGESIFIKPFLAVNFVSQSAINKEKDADKKAAMQMRWDRGIEFLEQNNGAAIIRNEITAVLGKDSGELSIKALEALRALDIDAVAEKSVHAATLKSWIKERQAAGNPVDTVTFGVWSGDKAEIQLPPKPKQKQAPGPKSSDLA